MFDCNCGRIFEKKSSLNSHARFCNFYEKKEKKSKYICDDLSYLCECGKKFKKHNQLNGHFNYCLIHRNGILPARKESGKWPPKGAMSGWNKFSEDEIKDFYIKSRTSLSEKMKSGEIQHHFLGKNHTTETKQKISLKAKENNNGLVKCKYYDVYCPYRSSMVKVQGTWEKRYAEYLNDNKILWDNSREIKMNYKIDQDDYFHTYYPDFYLPTTQEYIEIKGFWWKSKDGRVDDKRKMQMVVKCNPNKKIRILERNDLKILLSSDRL